MNDKIKDYAEHSTVNVDKLTEGVMAYESQEDMGKDFTEFLGYDPTTAWDRRIMSEQVDKLADADTEALTWDDREDTVDQAMIHYNAIKPNVMLQVAQKTIKSLYDREVTCDDLNLDLDYLMNTEIFGSGYEEDEDEDEDDNSLLDELEEDEDDQDFDNDEEDLVN